MKQLVINPNLELLDPVTGQVRNSESGQVFTVSAESLSLLSVFSEAKEVGDDLNVLSEIIDCEDTETIKNFVRSLISQGILVDPVLIHQKSMNDIEISDIALVEKPFYSCLGVPISNIDSDYPYDIAILGVPFDIGSTGFPGSRFGPKRIREISGDSIDSRYKFSDLSCCGWDSERGKKMCDGLRIVDVGDVIHQIGEPYKSFYSRLERSISGILKSGAVPVSIGGDHSCLYSILKGIIAHRKESSAADGDVHLIVFDAHTDLADYDSRISHNHGNVVTRLVGEGVVQKVTQVGLRGMVGRPFVREEYTPIYADQCGSTEEIMSLLPLVDAEDVYISFDIDSIDPVYAPGTGTPVPLGLHPTTVLNAIIKIIQKSNVVGLDIVEYNPMMDSGSLTGNTIVNMLPKILDAWKGTLLDNDIPD